MVSNNSTNNFGLSPYIVNSTAGKGSYTTIQAAINAATEDGGGTVFLQQGTYTEDLDLSSIANYVEVVGTTGVGDEGQVEIVGTHTPPTAGTTFIFRNTRLSSATDIFKSAAAGKSHLVLIGVSLNVESGYSFNLPNWTGRFDLFDVNPGTGEDGGVNNIGGASLYMFYAKLGSGTTKNMILSGPTTLFGVDIGCPLTAQGTASISVDNSTFYNELTFSNTSSQSISNSRINSGTTAAITTSSSSAVILSNVVIDSTASPVIDGSGSIEFTNVSYVQGSEVAGTLTKVYTTEVENGIAFLQNVSFDRGNTTVSADGQLIIGDSTGVPKIATLSAGSNINITNSPGKITIASTGVGFSYTEKTDDFTMSSGSGYIMNKASSTIVATLPATASEGTTIKIVGKGESGWSIAQQAGQTIHFGSCNTKTGTDGLLASTNQYDCIELICTVKDTDWTVRSAQGNLNVD